MKFHVHIGVIISCDGLPQPGGTAGLRGQFDGIDTTEKPA